MKPYFLTASSSSSELNADNPSGIEVAWDEEIATNALPVSVKVTGSCVADTGCTLANDVNLTSAGKSLVIPAGNSDRTIDVTVHGDERVEPDEVLTLSLSSDHALVVADPALQLTHAFTIQNDDSLGLTTINTDAIEGGDSASIEF